MLILKILLLVLALACFLVDTLRVLRHGPQEHMGIIPLGLACWTLYWIIELLY